MITRVKLTIYFFYSQTNHNLDIDYGEVYHIPPDYKNDPSALHHDGPPDYDDVSDDDDYLEGSGSGHEYDMYKTNVSNIIIPEIIKPEVKKTRWGIFSFSDEKKWLDGCPNY